jgi:hypothetical protein
MNDLVMNEEFNSITKIIFSTENGNTKMAQLINFSKKPSRKNMDLIINNYEEMDENFMNIYNHVFNDAPFKSAVYTENYYVRKMGLIIPFLINFNLYDKLFHKFYKNDMVSNLKPSVRTRDINFALKKQKENEYDAKLIEYINLMHLRYQPKCMVEEIIFNFDASQIAYVRNQYNKIIKKALDSDPENIIYIINPTEEMYIDVVQRKPELFINFHYHTQKICNAALNADPNLLPFID